MDVRYALDLRPRTFEILLGGPLSHARENAYQPRLTSKSLPAWIFKGQAPHDTSPTSSGNSPDNTEPVLFPHVCGRTRSVARTTFQSDIGSIASFAPPLKPRNGQQLNCEAANIAPVPRTLPLPLSTDRARLQAAQQLPFPFRPPSVLLQNELRTSNPGAGQARRFQGRRSRFSNFAAAFVASDLHFEAPLKIVEYPNPILRARNKRIVAFDENLKKLVKEMFDVMYKTDGIGLSAPQVGLNVRLLVFNPAGERGVGEELVLINPKVHRFSKKIVLFNEGCLSFPGIYADVERPESVKVDAQDITGATFSVNFSGLPARVFQHEFDHLLGVLFFDRMTEEVLDSIRSELQVGTSFPKKNILCVKYVEVELDEMKLLLAFGFFMEKLALEKKYETMTGLPSPEKVENSSRRKEAAGFGRS
ncbi:Peptide deformylase 1B, chloroplastic [Asimina triloba]